MFYSHSPAVIWHNPVQNEIHIIATKRILHERLYSQNLTSRYHILYIRYPNILKAFVNDLPKVNVTLYIPSKKNLEFVRIGNFIIRFPLLFGHSWILMLI